MTDLHANSKSDTILLLDTGVADPWTDLGPERTDLVDQTTYIEEDPSARSAIAAPRNITIKVAMQSGWSGILLYFGPLVGTYSYQISLAASVLSFAENGILRTSVTVPGLTGSNRTVLINWSQRVEGANVIDDVAVGNLTTGEWVFGRGSHAAFTPNSAHILSIAAKTGGTSAYTGLIDAFTAVHIGRRFHSSTEAMQDWGTAATAATFDGYDRAPILTGTAATLVLPAEGEFVGPSYYWAAVATRQAAQRAVGAFANLSIRSPNAEGVTASPSRFYRATPDNVTGWKWCTRYLWHGYLSPKVNVAQVRIHVRAYDSMSGGATVNAVSFRSYSIANLPLNGSPVAPIYNRGAIVSTSTTTTTSGSWLDLGLVTLARDANGLSYFALGFRFATTNVNEGITFNTTWKLNAITVDPFGMDLDGGGDGEDLGLVDP